jgi:flagellar biosynthesis/type III secretory pathway protein FliH
MNLEKGLVVVATLSLMGLSVGCSDRYSEGFIDGKAEGFASGYDRGYDDGYLDGDEAGFERARVYFASSDYNSGYAAGVADTQAQVTVAYNNGYGNGYDDGYDDGIMDGYDLGYDDGIMDGYDLGYDDGIMDGYDLGYDDGILDGYDIGYDDGFGDGYDIGYDDGFLDGSFSVGKTKALKGYANLLSMAHNDIFDYSKISAPKQTARGLVVNGKLLFEETSLTNKDTLKRKAVVEQYLVSEMAKQVQSKFGLSAERSLKVAKASNHFRKFSSKRALTSEDTNSYVVELIGVDLETMENAFEAGEMSSVLQKAASTNGISSEKMAQMLARHFI